MTVAVQERAFGSQKKLAFLALHLHDLQTLRWLGVQVGLLLCPVFFLVEHAWQGWALLGMLLAFAAIWRVGFAQRMHRRYGCTRLSPAQKLRSRYPSPLLALIPAGFLLAHFCSRYLFHTHGDDYIFLWVPVLWIAAPICDRTNPLVRRVAYAGAMAVLILSYLQFAVWRPMDDWRGSLAISSLGLVLLALALFDYNLLRRAVNGNALKQGRAA